MSLQPDRPALGDGKSFKSSQAELVTIIKDKIHNQKHLLSKR